MDRIQKVVEWKRSAAILQEVKDILWNKRVEELGNDNVPETMRDWRQSITGLKIVGFARG